MSLKAKLEAVIYAAEEPVTLNLLAALFAADALEWKAQLEAAAAERAAEVAGVSPDAIENLPLIELVVERPASPDAGGPTETPASADSGPVARSEPGGPDASEAPPPDQVVLVSEAETYPSIVVDGEPASPAADTAVEPAPPADAESDAKRLARQKDREVKAILKQLLDELIAAGETDGRGVEIREIAGGYRMATKPEYHDAVRLFVKSLKPPLKLSLPALETLAVIAYKQPVTAPEVNEIRGVESSAVLGSLLARKLIATAGRKPVIGRPILYKTTKEFLLRFGLKDVSELPSMEEFEKMAATELEMEPEAVEADRAADAAEAAAAGAGEAGAAQDNASGDLESGLPRGLELAATDEAAENPTEREEASPAADTAELPAPSTEAPESANQRSQPEESGQEPQSEATSHAQESQQQTAQKEI